MKEMSTKVEVKPFIDLLRRVIKSKYKNFIMINRLIMQCYTIDNDEDIGQHYVMAIPNTSEYESKFYDLHIEFTPNDILSVYSEGHTYLGDRRKELGLKPKDAREELYVSIDNGNLQFKFLFILDDAIVKIEKLSIPYPVNRYSVSKEICEEAFTNIIKRVKPGGLCVLLECVQSGIMQRVIEYPDIYVHTIKMNNTKVRIPLMKSMFMGNSKWERVMISIQETVFDDIYLMVMQFTKNGLTDMTIGYIQNY